VRERDAEIVALDVFKPRRRPAVSVASVGAARLASAALVGSVHDDLVLDERDVLRPASMPVRS
jgi:hypothetical protein